MQDPPDHDDGVPAQYYDAGALPGGQSQPTGRSLRDTDILGTTGRELDHDRCAP